MGLYGLQCSYHITIILSISADVKLEVIHYLDLCLSQTKRRQEQHASAELSPDGHLGAEEPLALEVELGVGLPGAVAPDPRLHGANKLVDLVVADLLHQTQHAGPELM